jgi:hypothetical protein
MKLVENYQINALGSRFVLISALLKRIFILKEFSLSVEIELWFSN